MKAPDIQAIRKALFTQCESQEQLSRWLKIFLDLDLPDAVVSEESNISPMGAIWFLYDKARRNDFGDMSRFMIYSSRGAGKTLSASALEFLMVFHFGRQVGHMASILPQSVVSQGYLQGFADRPYVRDFKVGQNVKRMAFSWFTGNGQILSISEFEELPAAAQRSYTQHSTFVQTVICNMAGANGFHCNGAFIVDEVDVIPKQNIPAYHQAKSIPDAKGGIIPFTLLTSTRKSRIGLVQAELDNAINTGLQALHWNIVDVTESCGASRHKPELPRVRYWVNDSDVRHITDEEYGTISPMEQSKFYPVDGFSGCEKCRLFPACKGRLATHQTSKSKFLKPIPAVIGWFKGAPTPEYITCEFLCRRPDQSGLVYPRLNRDLHVKSAQEIAAMVAGEPVPAVTDRASLLKYLQGVGARFATGIDFGFTHPFAAVTVAIWGQYAFVVDVVARTGLELDEKIEACQHLKALNPTVYGDTEAPADIKTFRRRGFKIKDWSKFPGSVKAGIEVVRSKLWSLAAGPTLFFLAEDPGVEFLYRQMESYAFKTDVVGDFTEDPDDDNDDGCDAIRYCLMNSFAKGGALKDTGSAVVSSPGAQQLGPVPAPNPGQQSTWMQELIRSHLEAPGEDPEPEPEVKSVRKGRFSWSI